MYNVYVYVYVYVSAFLFLDFEIFPWKLCILSFLSFLSVYIFQEFKYSLPICFFIFILLPICFIFKYSFQKLSYHPALILIFFLLSPTQIIVIFDSLSLYGSGWFINTDPLFSASSSSSSTFWDVIRSNPQ